MIAIEHRYSDSTTERKAKLLRDERRGEVSGLAIARILAPGCKADHILVLEGEQGIGKSTAARTLAGEWFTDQLGEVGSKDASMQVRGVWIVELFELGTLGRSKSAREKAFTSQQTERFRLPYGHRIAQVPRQCVFIGTTNLDAWLGHRRPRTRG